MRSQSSANSSKCGLVAQGPKWDHVITGGERPLQLRIQDVSIFSGADRKLKIICTAFLCICSNDARLPPFPILLQILKFISFFFQLSRIAWPVHLNREPKKTLARCYGNGGFSQVFWPNTVGRRNSIARDLLVTFGTGRWHLSKRLLKSGMTHRFSGPSHCSAQANWLGRLHTNDLHASDVPRRNVSFHLQCYNPS